MTKQRKTEQMDVSERKIPMDRINFYNWKQKNSKFWNLEFCVFDKTD